MHTLSFCCLAVLGHHLRSPQDPLEQYGISDETRFQVSNGLQPKQRDTSSL